MRKIGRLYSYIMVLMVFATTCIITKSSNVEAKSKVALELEYPHSEEYFKVHRFEKVRDNSEDGWHWKRLKSIHIDSESEDGRIELYNLYYDTLYQKYMYDYMGYYDSCEGKVSIKVGDPIFKYFTKLKKKKYKKKRETSDGWRYYIWYDYSFYSKDGRLLTYDEANEETNPPQIANQWYVCQLSEKDLNKLKKKLDNLTEIIRERES